MTRRSTENSKTKAPKDPEPKRAAAKANTGVNAGDNTREIIRADAGTDKKTSSSKEDEYIHESTHTHKDGTVHTHTHHHSADEYKQLQRRISIIIGHVTSIKKMIEDKRDCSEILIQISAVQASINNLGKLILRNHINECLSSVTEATDPVEHQKEIDYLNDAIDKFIR